MSYLGDDIFQDYWKMANTVSIDDHFKKCMDFYNLLQGEYYDNNFLKGKKMNNVFQVLAIQEHADKLPTILVPITTVIATAETAVQNFLIENAAELKDKENVQILCRPFC